MRHREGKRQRQNKQTQTEMTGTLRNEPGHSAFVPSEVFHVGPLLY